MPTIQYSARNARLSVHKLFTSCIRRGLVSRDSIVDGDWLPATEWCQRYLPCCQPASDVAKNRGWGSCTEYTRQGNDFELISTVEMETRNPVEDYFGSEFSTICNHCGVMSAWSRKTSNIFEKFLRFSEKRPLTVKFSKFCFESFYRDTGRRYCVVFRFREIWQTGNRWNRALLTWQKIRLALQLSLLRGSPPIMYSECSRFHPSRFTLGGVTI